MEVMHIGSRSKLLLNMCLIEVGYNKASHQRIKRTIEESEKPGRSNGYTAGPTGPGAGIMGSSVCQLRCPKFQAEKVTLVDNRSKNLDTGEIHEVGSRRRYSCLLWFYQDPSLHQLTRGGY
jgi:hypothetical protein